MKLSALKSSLVVKKVISFLKSYWINKVEKKSNNSYRSEITLLIENPNNITNIVNKM